MFRILARNVVWNWLGFGVLAVIMFLLTPIVLQELGETRYAVWALVTSLTGYCGLVDMGLRSGINQYLTRYLARGEMDKVNQIASTAFFALAAIACLIMSAVLMIAFLLPNFVELPEEVTLSEAFWCVILVGAAVALEFLLFPFMCILMAKQRYDLANMGSITGRLVAAISTYVALKSGYGLVAIAASSLAGNLVDYISRSVLGVSLVPGLRVSPRRVSMERGRELGTFSAWTFLINASQTILLHTTPLVIAASSLELAAITWYSLGSSLARYLNELLNAFARVFFPAATNLHAQGDKQGLRDLYHGGTRTLTLCCVVLGVVGWFWASDFYRLWVGDELTSDKVAEVVLLFQILMVAVIGGQIPNIGRQVLLGAKQVKLLAIFTILEAAINLLLLFWLIEIPSVGLKGAALAQLVPMFLVRCIAVPFVTVSELKCSVTGFLQSLLKPAAVLIVLAPSLFWLSNIHRPTGWLDLVTMGFVSAIIALPTVLFLGLTGDERKRLVNKLPKRLYSG